MQKDEVFLLRPWLAYHGYLFGFENIFVLDNGSTRFQVRATLSEFARKGVHVDWSHDTREDYLAKGDLIGDEIRMLDSTHEYDFLVPLDCDEFIVLRTEADIICEQGAILSYLATLAGERRILRFPYQLANHPLFPDFYHYYSFFKVFFPAGTFMPVDHGHHVIMNHPEAEVMDTRLIHLHFHHKTFDMKQAQARQSWVGTANVDDREIMANYSGPSAHLNRFFLQTKDQYYASFHDLVHFHLPQFRALLRDLGAPLELPTEPVAANLQMRTVTRNPELYSEANGVVVVIPETLGATRDSSPAPAEFRMTRFHEGHYLSANPGLIEACVNPTVHYSTYGFKENRLLHPATEQPARGPLNSDRHQENATARAKIAAYVAGEGPVRPATDGKRCIELGAGDLARPEGWLTTDLKPSRDALQLDVTRPFPIEDGSFDYIYSQHMIEHLDFGAGRFMLRECFRILKPGGTIRIVTPSIGFLIGLFSSDRQELTDRYIQWSTETFVQSAPKPMPSVAFNNFVRAWGHRFIYDEATLEQILTEAGFTAIQECEIGASRHARLRGLESTDRLPAGFFALENMIMEATRPLSGQAAS